MRLGFEVEAAKPRPTRVSEHAVDYSEYADEPVREPMRPDKKISRNPSSDQKKVRRRLNARTAVEEEASKETTVDTSRQREASLLAEMADAPLGRQAEIAYELDELRRHRSAALQAERDLHFASEVVADHLTPVIPHTFHTTATDWLEDVEPGLDVADDDIHTSMRAEASLWFDRVHPEVRADREEFAEQAMGVARRLAGQYGLRAEAAYRSFLDHVSHLHRREGATRKAAYGDPCVHCDHPHVAHSGLGVCTAVACDCSDYEWSDARTVAGTTTPVHSVCPNCGETQTQADMVDKECGYCGASLVKTSADADRNSYPANEQAGYGESGLGQKAEDDPHEESMWDEDWEDTGDAGHHPPMPGAGGQSQGVKTAGLFDTTCELCGHQPSDPRKVYYSAMTGRTQCVDGVACAKRQQKSSEGSVTVTKTAGVYCKTHDVWVGEGNASTHEDCAKEQRATDKTKESKVAQLAVCKHCGNRIEKREDPSGQRGEAWAEAGEGAWDYDDWNFQCGMNPDSNRHEPGSVTAVRKTATRAIHEIAAEIEATWPNVNYAARPYLDAMHSLSTPDDMYGADQAKWIVAYFLSNASSWRGEDAKRIKKELKDLAKLGAAKRAAKAGDTCEVCGKELTEAEVAALNEDRDFVEHDDHTIRVASSLHTADTAEAVPASADEAAHGESSLDDVEVGDPNDTPMWPWELAEGDPATGQGASDVSAVPTPGGESGYPQPTASRTAEKIPFECFECGNKFSRSLSASTTEVKCPRCGGYDTMPDIGYTLGGRQESQRGPFGGSPDSSREGVSKQSTEDSTRPAWLQGWTPIGYLKEGDRFTLPDGPELGVCTLKQEAANGRVIFADESGTERQSTPGMKAVKVSVRQADLRKGAPFAGYDDFDDCVSKNSDKDDPEAYCGKIKHDVEDSKESAKQADRDDSFEEGLTRLRESTDAAALREVLDQNASVRAQEPGDEVVRKLDRQDEVARERLRQLEGSQRARTEAFRARVQANLSRQALPNPADHGVAVGDFFVWTWGYDQTNVDFFEVIGLTGASVRVQNVDNRVVDGQDGPSEKVVPVPGTAKFSKPPQTKRLLVLPSGEPYLSVEYGWCKLWNGEPVYQTGASYGH